MAILGLVGGFLTPVLLSTGVDNEVGLFTYVALLDAGVLAVAYFKRWRSLDFLSFAGTVAMALGWAFKFFSPDKVWTTLFFLSVFFLLYSLLPIFHNVLRGRPSRWFDVSLAIANATFYFGLSYLMLTETGFDHATPATQALLLVGFLHRTFLHDMALEFRRPSAQVQLFGGGGNISQRRGGNSAGTALGDDCLGSRGADADVGGLAPG